MTQSGISKIESVALAESNTGLKRIISALFGIATLLALLYVGKIAFFVVTIVIFSASYLELFNLLKSQPKKTRYLLGGLFFIGLIFFLNAIMFQPSGKTAVLFTLIGVWVFDTAAYYVGSRFGHHKIMPKISPNKSFEGLIAAIVAVVLLSLFLPGSLLFESSPVAFKIAWVILICLGAFSGDTIESAFKRKIGVKDSSSIIPGHGGFLDRFDSLFVTSFLSFIFFRVVS